MLAECAERGDKRARERTGRLQDEESDRIATPLRVRVVVIRRRAHEALARLTVERFILVGVAARLHAQILDVSASSQTSVLPKRQAPPPSAAEAAPPPALDPLPRASDVKI